MTDTELEWRFIRARLIGHGMLLSEKLQEGILTQQLIDSRKLLNSLQWHVNMDESAASGELVIEFKIYGRFQEIGAGRQAKNKTDFLDLFIGGNKTRRKRPWYNKTVYGTLNDLIYDLVNGFTDETKAMLKSQILRYDKFIGSNG
jgi:hypothetical protein